MSKGGGNGILFKDRIRRDDHRSERNTPVKQTQSKVAPVPMCAKRHLCHCTKIVHPVQMWLMRRGVVATKEEVN